MIKVVIEIIPFGNRAETREIGGLVIWNDATGDINKGNYQFMLGTDPTAVDRKVTKVKGHYRSEGVMKLLYLCLKKIYGKKGKSDE